MASDVVKRVFLGHNLNVKPFQEQAIVSLVSGKDVFVSVPTGHGKTFAYCFLPEIFSILQSKPFSIVIVISPLISLMIDQVSRMETLGIKAAFVGEGQTSSTVITDVKNGLYNIVFISPEAILESSWRYMLNTEVYQNCLSTLVIDECHCIEEWYDLSTF